MKLNEVTELLANNPNKPVLIQTIMKKGGKVTALDCSIDGVIDINAVILEEGEGLNGSELSDLLLNAQPNPNIEFTVWVIDSGDRCHILDITTTEDSVVILLNLS